MNFIDKLYQAVATAYAKPLLYEVRGETLNATTGEELQSLVDHVRGFLAAYGIKPGDRVGLCASNSARWIAADLAILGAGAIVVPLYDRQAPKELAAMLHDCGAAVVLVEEARLCDALAQAWPSHATLALFDDVFAHAPWAADPTHHADTDCISLIYTSGTSGEPKGVLYTVANVDFMLTRATARMREMVEHHEGQERMFHYLPFAFASSRITLWVQLLRQSPLYLSTELKNLPSELAAVQPHYFLNVPAMLERIRTSVAQKVQERGGIATRIYTATVAAYERLHLGRWNIKDQILVSLGKTLLFRRIKQQVGANLEFLICGSAPLAESTQRWFSLLGVPVYQVYGLTETTAIVTMDSLGRTRPGHVGRPIADVELKLTPEGELLCRGGNIFPEYWQRPEASHKVLCDGWFHTGDLAELSPEGDVKIIGRAKDLVVLQSGFNIAPDPLEARLAEHALGAQVIVVGHGRPYLTALFAGGLSEPQAQQALDAVNADLPHAKQIRRCKVVPDTWSNDNGLLTANLKLRRSVVERRYANEIQSLYG